MNLIDVQEWDFLSIPSPSLPLSSFRPSTVLNETFLLAHPLFVLFSFNQIKSSTELKTFCPNNEFLCSNGEQCIPSGWVCDRSKDCSDGSDENACGGKTLSVEKRGKKFERLKLVFCDWKIAKALKQRLQFVGLKQVSIRFKVNSMFNLAEHTFYILESQFHL